MPELDVPELDDEFDMVELDDDVGPLELDKEIVDEGLPELAEKLVELELDEELET